MNPRTEIDPETKLPMEVVEQESAAASMLDERSSLLKQASFISISESQCAGALLAMVEKRLTSRLEYLVGADPEAKALCELVKDFGRKVFSAKLAAKQMVNKFSVRIKSE